MIWFGSFTKSSCIPCCFQCTRPFGICCYFALAIQSILIPFSCHAMAIAIREATRCTLIARHPNHPTTHCPPTFDPIGLNGSFQLQTAHLPGNNSNFSIDNGWELIYCRRNSIGPFTGSASCNIFENFVELKT